eukprot:scaffold3574_cov49-Attheya_sp.AAC.3
MDWFLIIATLAAFIILLVVGFYILIYYSHPDDKNDAYFPKAVVVLGFVLAGGTVLLLPLDVANNEGYPGCDGFDTELCGGLNMELFWNIFFWLIPIWVFLLIPFMTFYYEADDGMLMAGTSIGGEYKSKLRTAVVWEGGVVIVVGLSMALAYLFLSNSDVPIREYNGISISDTLVQVEPNPIYQVTPQFNGTNSALLPFQPTQIAPMGTADLGVLNQVQKDDELQSIVLQVNIGTFLAGFMAFVGWFFFAVFGGIGLAALPLDLILTFVNRPRHMDAVEFAEAQQSIRERVNDLVTVGEELKLEIDGKEGEGEKKKSWFGGGQTREEKKIMNEFRRAVFLLEKDVEDFQNCSANYNKTNPLIPFAALLFGIFAIIISICWVVQIAIYVLPEEPIHPFLNTYFAWFDNWFPLFGVLTVAIFATYLLFCAIKGCFKFGLRFLFFTLHPMEVNKTYMSSFMFNIGLVLLCALPVVQFCSTAFADYARYATVQQVFGTQIQYLQFFRYFWTNNIFVYILLSFTALTILYLTCKPRDRSTNAIDLRDRLKSR